MQSEGGSKAKNILKKLGFWGLIILVTLLILFLLILLIGAEALVVLIFLFPIIIAAGIAFYILKQPSITVKGAVITGLILGFVFLVIDSIESFLLALSGPILDGFNYTALGSMLFRPLDWLSIFIYRLFPIDIRDIFGNIFLYFPPFLVSVTFSLLTRLSFKHFVRKEKNENTKYVMIADIIFIGLMFLSFIWFLFKSA